MLTVEPARTEPVFGLSLVAVSAGAEPDAVVVVSDADVGSTVEGVAALVGAAGVVVGEVVGVAALVGAAGVVAGEVVGVAALVGAAGVVPGATFLAGAAGLLGVLKLPPIDPPILVLLDVLSAAC
jgi:hypothetical protein